jgi:hypothetical protein
MNNRHLYPKNWKQLATACKDAAGWCCTICKVLHGSTRVSWAGREYKVYMVAAHRDHDRSNPNPVLICCCPSCHWRYYRYRPGHPPVWIIERLKLQKARQGVKLCYSR